MVIVYLTQYISIHIKIYYITNILCLETTLRIQRVLAAVQPPSNKLFGNVILKKKIQDLLKMK